MEKEPQPDSLTDVTVKQYAPSEVYSAEPPPKRSGNGSLREEKPMAYHRPQSTAVHVARIAAITVVVVSVVLGAFILAAAYIQANASCQQLQQELQLLQEEQRLQAAYQQPLQPEALIQEEPQSHQSQSSSHHVHQNAAPNKDLEDNNISQDSSETDESSEDDSDEDRTPIHIKLPLQLDFDELAGAMMDKNQRSRMNCIVEKKRAEEMIDHQAKTLRLPFGLNLTTDPRFERVTGERMAIFCESGDEQRQMPQQEETMMIQPIIVPLQGPGPMHPMQAQMRPQLHQEMQMRPQQQMMPQPMETVRAHTIIMEQIPQHIPVPVPVAPQHPNMQHQQNQMPQEIQHPNHLMQQIAQQIIAQHEMAAAAAAQQHHQQQQQHQQQQLHPEMPQAHHKIPEAMLRRLPVPEEILTQINRLPNQDVIVSVSEQEAEEVPPENIRVIQHQRENAQEMNGRQSYAHGLPVHIPVPMMQHMQHVQPVQEQQPEDRPHYVQPRSVRSVDNLLHREKRVKRCSCDCAC